MRWWEWLLIWNLFSDGDRNRGSNSAGCLTVILVILGFIGLSTLGSFLESTGQDESLIGVARWYLAISLWDVVYDIQEVTKAFKLMSFIIAFGILGYVTYKFELLEESGKYKYLRVVFLYLYVSPHFLILFVRMVYTAFFT